MSSKSAREALSPTSVAILMASFKCLTACISSGEIAFKLRLDVVANIDLPDVGHVRSSVEEENPVHQLFRVNHFFDGFFAVMGPEPEIAPVIAHFAVEEILIDGCELRLKRFALVFVNFIVSAHAGILAA